MFQLSQLGNDIKQCPFHRIVVEVKEVKHVKNLEQFLIPSKLFCYLSLSLLLLYLFQETLSGTGAVA